MDADTLRSLLGKPSTDSIVESALRHFGIVRRPAVKIDSSDADGPVVASQDWVSNLSAGVEFGFQEQDAFMGLDLTAGTNSMILTEVYFYAERPGARPYQPALPFGLSLQDGRNTVRKKMAPFERTRRSYVRDTWEPPGFRFTVSYRDDTDRLDYVVGLLRQESEVISIGGPLPTAGELIPLLGSRVTSPAAQDLLNRLGLGPARVGTAAVHVVDGRRKCGLRLHFHPAGPDLQLSLRQIEFLSAGELGAVGWPGSLPLGLEFADSPERVIERIGRVPDNQVDQEFTGHAYWRFSDYSILVMYSTMENLVLRVSLFSAETEQ